MLQFLKSLLGGTKSASARPASRRAPLRLERLEEREVPAVAAGAHGEVFANFSASNTLYERNASGAWLPALANNARSVSVNAAGTVAASFQDGSLWTWSNGAWQSKPIAAVGAEAQATAIGPDGTVYGVFYRDRELFAHDTAGNWHYMASNATSVSAGANGEVVATFSDGTMWQSLGGTNWQSLQVAPTTTAVAVGPHGEVYGTFSGATRALWERDASGVWHDLKQSGVTSLSAGADGTLDAIFSDGSLRQFNGSSWQTLASGADTDLGLSAVQFGLSNLGQPVTFGGYQPTCANFVIMALQAAGAKTTVDYGVVDPPGQPSGQTSNVDYVWGNLVLTYHPGSTPLSALNALQPGDVLQFRNVGQQNGPTTVQHTAIVYQNLGNGKLLVLQQNYNNQQFVTLDPMDLSLMNGGTIWVYQPVAK